MAEKTLTDKLVLIRKSAIVFDIQGYYSNGKSEIVGKTVVNTYSSKGVAREVHLKEVYDSKGNLLKSWFSHTDSYLDLGGDSLITEELKDICKIFKIERGELKKRKNG